MDPKVPSEQEQEKKPDFIAIKVPIDRLVETMLTDKAKGVNILVLSIPLSVGKHTALGFLWSAMDTLTTFYKHVEAQVEKRQSGLIKPGVKDIMKMGRSLMGG